MANLTIGTEDVRIDDKSGYVCLTDMAKLKGDSSLHIQNWTRNVNSLAFFEAWETLHNPAFKPSEFEGIKKGAGLNTHYVSVKELCAAGCSGIESRRGRYGGTYAHIDWAVHFANWLDPQFYVMTIAAFRQMNDALLGRHHLELRFSRELAAETYALVTGQVQSALPPAADALLEKRIASVEADILNLALWGMTAREWRIKHPQTDGRKNMRDYATPEELKALSALQVVSQELHEQGYSSEERLDRLGQKAGEFIRRFCNNAEKQDLLLLTQHKRGWGRFEF